VNFILAGLCVLNTRPGEQGKLLNQAITMAGGMALDCPFFSIEFTKPDWIDDLPDLSTVNTAIFTSINAVHGCFHVLQQPLPDTINIVAIGKTTAKVLQEYGVKTVQTPEVADSQHLLEMPVFQKVGRKNIVLFKGKNGLNLIENTLAQRKANLTILNVYKRVVLEPDPFMLNSLWRRDVVDIILITSEEILNSLFAVFPETWLAKKTCLVVSERLAEKARNLGINNILMSTPETILNTLITFRRTFHDWH